MKQLLSFRFIMPVILLTLTVVSSNSNAENILDSWNVMISPPPLMVGFWHGEGDNGLSIDKSKPGKITFDIHIDALGNVLGSIGDAKITNGELQNNAWFRRWFGALDYRVLVNLSGAIIIKEQMTHKTGILQLGIVNSDQLKGSFLTGSGEFGTESVALPVKSIEFKRVY